MADLPTQHTRPRRLAAAVSLLVLLQLGAAAAAHAHPAVVQSTPAGGSIPPRTPKTIQIEMSERVVLRGSSIELRDGAGREQKLGDLRDAEGAEGFAASVEETLPADVYSVRWVALGNDGHTVSGSFNFGVPRPDGGPPPGVDRLAAAGGLESGDEGAEGLLPVAVRWVGLIAAFVLLGGAVLGVRLRRSLAPELARRFEERWQRLTTFALALALAAAVEAVIAAAAAPETSSGLDLAVLTDSATGALALTRLGLITVAVVVAARLTGARRTAVAGTAGALALLTHALDGHTSALREDRVIAGLGQVAHLEAAGVWVGGAIVLAACLLPAAPRGGRVDALRPAVARFAPVAGFAALVVVATGVLTAFREVADDYFLFWSDYGRMLLVKVGLVAVLVALGTTAALWLRRSGRTGAAPAAGGAPARLLSAEAGVALAVLALAAALAGTVQGRGQPLPAQRGNLFPGPAFAADALGTGVMRLTLAPARTGSNDLIVFPDRTSDFEPPAPQPRSMRVRLRCACSEDTVEATLRRAGDSWRATLELPEEGIWDAALLVDGRRTGSSPLTVGVPEASGAEPALIASVADLSGPAAARCRAQQLGLLVSIGLMNRAGGLDGHKVELRTLDDRGDPVRARNLALELAADEDAVAFALPCGDGGAAVLEAVGDSLPTIVADPEVQQVAGRRVFRLAPDPEAEGFAAGQFIRENAFRATPDAPRRVVVLSDGAPAARTRLQGLRDALGEEGIAVERIPLHGGHAEQAVLRRALARDRSAGAFIDGPLSIAGDLARLSESTTGFVPTAILTPGRLYDERMQVESGTLGRGGAIRSVGDVHPQTRDGLVYTTFLSYFVGERATIPGLRGFTAGRALTYGLESGDDPASVTRRLQRPPRFSDAVVAPWSSDDPARGSQVLKVFGATFLPTGLVPQSVGGMSRTGRFFTDGSWVESSPELYSPLDLPTASPDSEKP